MSILDRIKSFFAGPTDSHSVDPDPAAFETGDIDLFDPFPEPVTIEITDVIDLHTIQPKEVKRVIEEYLEQVHLAGFQSVRIVHGKGIGVQREMVRTVLARTSFVQSWSDAPPDAGGLGATIVRLL
jgi:dsDNA-specific endonuclease/ATPase MutS2